MTEQEEEEKKMEADALRLIKRLEREQVAQDAQQEMDILQLRVAEVEFLLLENAPLNLIVYKQGDEVGVIDSLNQELCREVLQRILKEDKDKLAEL